MIIRKGEHFIDIFDGEIWYSIQVVHRKMTDARNAVKEILDRDGNETPVRIRDYLGGVVWTNADLIGKT